MALHEIVLRNQSLRKDAAYVVRVMYGPHGGSKYIVMTYWGKWSSYVSDKVYLGHLQTKLHDRAQTLAQAKRIANDQARVKQGRGYKVVQTYEEQELPEADRAEYLKVTDSVADVPVEPKWAEDSMVSRLRRRAG